MLPHAWFATATFLVTLLACSCFAHPSLSSTFHTRLRPVSRSEKCPIMFDEDPPETSSRTASHQLDQPPWQADPRIANGDIAARTLVPFVVAIYGSGNPTNYSCTGTLVSSKWVVTAAHCPVSVNTRVLLGARRTSEATEDNLIGVKNVIPYREYNPDSPEGRSRDIAIFELEKDAPVNNTSFMKINVNPSLPKTDSFVRVLGFGRTSKDGDEDPAQMGVLRQVDVPINSNDDCNKVYPNVEVKSQICAGYFKDGGCDSCPGDSGGPMIQYNDEGKPVLVGIVSRGVRCARPKFPGVYTRTAAFADWMDQQSDFVKTTTTSTNAVFSSSANTGVIAGSAVAGSIALILLIILIIIIIRRRTTAPVSTPVKPPTGPAAPSNDNAVPAPNTNFVPAPDPPSADYTGGSGSTTPQWTSSAARMTYPGSHASVTPPHSLQLSSGPLGYTGATAAPLPPQAPHSQAQGPMIPPQQQNYAGHGQHLQEGSSGQVNMAGYAAPRQLEQTQPPERGAGPGGDKGAPPQFYS